MNNKPEVVKKPVTFEIHEDRFGNPYLKKVERRRNTREEGRGLWVPIGRVLEQGVDRVVRINREVGGLVCLPCEDGSWRALVLTD